MKFLLTSIVRAILIGSIILFLIFGSWLLWEKNSNVLKGIDIDPGKVELLRDLTYKSSFDGIPERTYRQITLETEYIGTIDAFISEPKIVPSKGLPVVIIMGGLEVNEDTFKLIHHPGDNIYVIFKYPYTKKNWHEGTPIIEIPVIRKSLLNVPSQALVLHQWISKQSWAEQDRITYAGFSFGAMFLPSIYHLADSHDKVLNPGVIAYAGADISDLLYTNMKKVDSPWRTFGAWLGEIVIYSLEPSHHLPYMNNEFLLINGTRDHQISTYSWKKLHRLIPEPKTVIILEEGHMHPRKSELTEKLVNISRNWFRERGLVN